MGTFLWSGPVPSLGRFLQPPFDAAIEACRLRLRPILMTCIAFIAGVFPLVVASGAGAEMRQAMGIAVFSGMIGVTLFGLFLTPVFLCHADETWLEEKTGDKPQPTVLARFKRRRHGNRHDCPAVHHRFRARPTGRRSDRITSRRPIPFRQITRRLISARGKQGQPLDNVPKGNWWEIFGDTNLNALEAQAVQANQQLKAAVARVDQARATARVARSQLMPNLSLNPSFSREGYSPNANPSFGNITANTFSMPLDLSYEVDLWGRIRRLFQSARADAQASLADYYNVLLTLQSDVAQNYFALRSLDAEIATVNGTVDLRHEQVRLVRSRFEGGIGSELDVAQAETELATTEAEAAVARASSR